MKIFVGYESAYPEMFEVCKASILRFNPTHEVIPLITSELEEQGIYTRKEKGNTEFAFTRFLVPYLSNYMGYSLFCDGDFLWRCDPQEITHFKKDNEEVMCVQHADLMFDQYTKMHDKLNKPYDKKYWSSLMYFNNKECVNLNEWYVNNAAARHLHGFTWASKVGSLPAAYNALVNYYDFGERAKGVHFTDGGPWMGINDHEQYCKEWTDIYNSL
jgi:hypothetical protein|tara:strand:- start:260 stop:904 length:645 start_codon:yes stop_codon:yes gene_type:complete